MDRTQPPLSPNEHAALDHLEQAAAQDTFAHDRAVEQLIAAGFVATAAHDLIETLCRKGYLTEDNDGLRISDSD
jgi:hypothetical protein